MSVLERSGCRGEGERSRRHAAKLMGLGLCTVCRKPNGRSTRRCLECTHRATAGNAKRKAEVKASGRCVNCGFPWSGLTKNCDSCKIKTREKWNKRAGSECCARCAGPRDTRRKACSKCLVLMRDASNRRRDIFAKDGCCVQCGKKRDLPAGLYCSEHLLRNQARRWLGSPNRWTELRDMLASQENRCAYSGEELTLGGNASIDHKIPRSRGGSDIRDIDNLQWVDWKMNRAKTDMTHDEFVSMCRLVSDRFIPEEARP